MKLETKRVMASAIAGTSAMTLFSYLVSELKFKNFREPHVLSQLIKTSVPDIDKQTSSIAGWCLHAGVGGLFASIYNEVWGKEILKPTIKSGIGLGAASGVLGILIWELTFKVHGKPPVKDFKKYYGHLFLAHLVFGAVALGGYKLVKDKRVHPQ